MKMKTKQTLELPGILCLATLLIAPAPVAGQEQADERPAFACWRVRPLPACTGLFLVEAQASLPLSSGTREVTLSSSRAQEAGRVGLESRIEVPLVWSETPSSKVPGKYMSLPSQLVASGHRQDNESGSIPDELPSLGGGVVGSWLVGVPVFYALNQTAGDRRVKGDAGYSPTAHWGMLVSSSIGAATGVHLVRKGLGATTSMKGALVGASLGTLPMVLGVDSPYLPYISFTVGSLLQAVGGLLGSR